MLSFVTPLESNANLFTEYQFTTTSQNMHAEIGFGHDIEDALLDDGYRIAS
ncbi:hypothetical protein HW450_02480 [Corynebacterium hindlerae]|uniref:Uncharacterized protein n=1 Tax=Corynebacterium hindlerae TaxID=699041 RepID=A0A7G5FG93_9CORY|nr:hypothetical protein [Corynebacterium hindlerae]QMV85634.1 hypothetical protein HW450_02480 [Corynebacterium hindlerae]QTH58485.1 hypothetical protein J5O04_06320 [Corynebacterium hindlerae]